MTTAPPPHAVPAPPAPSSWRSRRSWWSSASSSTRSASAGPWTPSAAAGRSSLVPTVRFALVYNPGVSFGMGAEVGPLLTVGIIALALGLAVWVGWQIRHRVSTLQVLLLTAVLAGALGNLFDRITRAEDGPLSGHVVDFIAVEWFAVFNVADILTVCGMIAWAVTMVFGRDHAADGRHAADVDAAQTDDAAAGDAPTGAGSAPVDRA
ncbi:signal peptidase II [Clavibacter tessellarius]|uniref:signal peptidase II n=1 Tax=Clavibacter tessellarius TaxID=31965 RepID=UPI003246982A